MRRAVFFTLGLLELTAAGLLAFLGCLADPHETAAGFGKAHEVTRRVGDQLHLVRRQMDGLRRPELRQLAEGLQTQTRTALGLLQDQQLDFETVRTLHEALGDVARGLDGVAGTLKPDLIGKLGEGLGETAGLMERIIPAAGAAADDLDTATEGLREDAERLAVLLRETPLDLKAAREIHNSLAAFSQGFGQLSRTMQPERLETLREGFQGMESALTTGAEQVEHLSDYTYPVVTLNGLKPEIKDKPFWPEGETIAKGLRKAAKGVSAAHGEMEALAKDLPKLRDSLEESRKVVDRTRETLGQALKQQDKLEPLLKELPAKAANLAANLPKLGKDLSRILRDTRRLKEVAATLRDAEAGTRGVVDNWPELQRTLSRSATMLRATRKQLQHVLDNRSQYESARNQTMALGESFATLLPVLSDQLDAQVRDQDRALDDLGRSVAEVGELMPLYGQAATRLVWTGRVLIWVLAGIFALHGLMTVYGHRPRRWYREREPVATR